MRYYGRLNLSRRPHTISYCNAYRCVDEISEVALFVEAGGEGFAGGVAAFGGEGAEVNGALATA